MNLKKEYLLYKLKTPLFFFGMVTALAMGNIFNYYTPFGMQNFPAFYYFSIFLSLMFGSCLIVISKKVVNSILSIGTVSLVLLINLVFTYDFFSITRGFLAFLSIYFLLLLIYVYYSRKQKKHFWGRDNTGYNRKWEPDKKYFRNMGVAIVIITMFYMPGVGENSKVISDSGYTKGYQIRKYDFFYIVEDNKYYFTKIVTFRDRAIYSDFLNDYISASEVTVLYDLSNPNYYRVLENNSAHSDYNWTTFTILLIGALIAVHQYSKFEYETTSKSLGNNK